MKTLLLSSFMLEYITWKKRLKGNNIPLSFLSILLSYALFKDDSVSIEQGQRLEKVTSDLSRKTIEAMHSV